MFSGLQTTSVFFFGLIFFWLLALSFFLAKAIRHYDNITKGVKGLTKKNLTSILEKFIVDFAKINKDVGEINERLKKQELESNFKIQKIGLLRFNPFADTGGEQSFIVSFLDRQNNGLIMTSLQGRTGTRWYVKMIKEGKGLEFNLSKEEEETVKKAKLLS